MLVLVFTTQWHFCDYAMDVYTVYASDTDTHTCVRHFVLFMFCSHSTYSSEAMEEFRDMDFGDRS